MADDHGAGADAVNVDTAGHWALKEGTDKGVGKATSFAVDMVEEAIYVSSAGGGGSVRASTAIAVPTSTNTRSAARQPHGHPSPTKTWRTLRMLALFLPAMFGSMLSLYVSMYTLWRFTFLHSESGGRPVALLDDILAPIIMFSVVPRQHLWLGSTFLAVIHLIGLHRILRFVRAVFSALWRWTVVLIKIALYAAVVLLCVYFCWLEASWHSEGLSALDSMIGLK